MFRDLLDREVWEEVEVGVTGRGSERKDTDQFRKSRVSPVESLVKEFLLKLLV